MAGGGTITRGPAGDATGARGPRWYLVLSLDCDRPRTAGCRVALDDLDRVEIGRGDADTVELERRGRSLRLAAPDGRMSTRHAELVRDGANWRVVDLGSKNGTYVDGDAVDEQGLADSQIVELGHSFFVVRYVADQPAPPASSAADELPAPDPALATFNLALAEDLAGAARVARSPAPILIRGDSGTGKEVLACALHRLSGRRGSMVAVNCAAIPRELIASELFGHKKGAFSGAVDDRAGLIHRADGGTLFLDEVAELSPPAQATLLRALQERQVRPVGASEPEDVDFRLIAASNRDLEACAAAGEFRGDLLARLAGLTVLLPSLAERIEDLGLLIARLLPRATSRPLRLSYTAARALHLYRWPSNVRELEHCLTSAAALATDEVIELAHLPPSVQAASAARPRPADDQQRPRLEALLAEHAGNVSAVARAMGITRMQVYRLATRYGLDLDRYR